MDNQKQFSTQKLLEIRDRLLKKREELKNELKTNHKGAYDWLVAHQINLNNLQKYTKNIAAAITLTNQLILTNPSLVSPPPAPTPSPKTDKDDTQNPKLLVDNNEKAKKVWELYGEIIDQVAKKYNLDRQLIFATIMTESEGDPEAHRFEPHIQDSSYGLGQVLYSTAIRLGFTGQPEDIYRPEIAIDLIGKYHKDTVNTYGELNAEQMTVVYNTGKLFGYPHPGHLARFKDWYYNYKKEDVKIV